MILDHAQWLLFLWILGNQGGVPVPVVPALLGAGALAGSGHLSLAMVTAVAVVASLGADLIWYGLGRWRGLQALKVIGRISPSAGSLVHNARRVFAAHLGPFQVSARFLPELNAIAGGLAGATKVGIIRFVSYGVLSALTWAGGWIGLGYFLSPAVTATAAHLDIRLIVLFLAPFALYLFFYRTRWHHVIRVLRQRGMNRGALSPVRETGDRAVGPDVQSAGRDEPSLCGIPGRHRALSGGVGGTKRSASILLP
jgi:membrane protein DedA with SNARE-associated domain